MFGHDQLPHLIVSPDRDDGRLWTELAQHAQAGGWAGRLPVDDTAPGKPCAPDCCFLRIGVEKGSGAFLLTAVRFRQGFQHKRHPDLTFSAGPYGVSLAIREGSFCVWT